jgi:biopolymer transport protein ExbB
MNTSLGIAHVWAQGDLITRSVAIILLTMSIISWTVMLAKLIDHLRYKQSATKAIKAFWESESNTSAIATITSTDKFGAFATTAADAFAAADAYEKNTAGGIGALSDKDEYLSRALQQSVVTSQTQMERGLTVLASTGATAPFVGLLGTVWGIYHALVGLTGVRQVGLDQVAGPVGEALIMTAAGLFVAIPAVLAYNACSRSNRLIAARLEGFANNLHSYLTSGIRFATQEHTSKN